MITAISAMHFRSSVKLNEFIYTVNIPHAVNNKYLQKFNNVLPGVKIKKMFRTVKWIS